MKAPKNFKRLIGEDWDFEYLLRLERYKLKRMAKYFEKSKLTVGWDKQVSGCNLAVKLLDIIVEEDAPYKHWLHESYGKKENGVYVVKEFPRYINTRNAKRFFPEWVEEGLPIHKSLKVELRRQKAWYLYNRLRYLRALSWWD